MHLFALVLVLLTLHCASSRPKVASNRPCESGEDCASGETCAPDFGGSRCLIACDSASDGRDPGCPRGFFCFEGTARIPGNTCRDENDGFFRGFAAANKYLRDLDAGTGKGVHIISVDDDDRVIGHSSVGFEDLARDR
jgi:hypothetical protein